MREQTIIRAEKKAKAIDLLGGVCVNCGSENRLEFDHIDRQTKKYNLARGWDRAWSSLLKELKKCQLLCRKCHLEKCATEKGYSLFDAVKKCGRGYRCKCTQCKLRNAAYMRSYRLNLKVA